MCMTSHHVLCGASAPCTAETWFAHLVVSISRETSGRKTITCFLSLPLRCEVQLLVNEILSYTFNSCSVLTIKIMCRLGVC